MSRPWVTCAYSDISEEFRFWIKVWPRGDCWERRGATANRYGRVMINGQTVQAHRYAYEAAKGIILPSLVVDHLCNHPWCVRPSHLVAVPQIENCLRGASVPAINRRKTLCQRGHRLVSKNIKDRPTWRHCPICAEMKRVERRKAQREAQCKKGKK